MNRDQLHSLLKSAKRRVRILGVVPLNVDWDDLSEAWSVFNPGVDELSVSILCESDNYLFAQSFLTDSEHASVRRPFRDLLFIRDLATTDFPRIANRRQKQFPNSIAASWTLQVTYLEIPVSLVEIDGALYASTNLPGLEAAYESVPENTPAFARLSKYLNIYFDPEQGRKYACDPGDEVLELFDHDRVPRGIYPRGSFYDTDFSQLVVWALVFDRQGRILIHRRADNAKDNQGMWDKSVGGHVDFKLDIGTSRAALRELVEELYQDEMKQGIGVFVPDDKDIVYLGEWRPSHRGRKPIAEIQDLSNRWCFFRMRDSQSVSSPRTTKTGGIRRLNVIADVFLFVADVNMNVEGLKSLKNSPYKLLELSELKTAMDRGLRNEVAPDFDASNPVPKFTPDLTHIMTGALRDQLEEFSQYLKRFASAKL